MRSNYIGISCALSFYGYRESFDDGSFIVRLNGIAVGHLLHDCSRFFADCRNKIVVFGGFNILSMMVGVSDSQSDQINPAHHPHLATLFRTVTF